VRPSETSRESLAFFRNAQVVGSSPTSGSKSGSKSRCPLAWMASGIRTEFRHGESAVEFGRCRNTLLAPDGRGPSTPAIRSRLALT
jgi:hypothetical protein